MKSLFPSRLLALSFLLTGMLVSSCSTGTSEGSTNVEHSGNKDFDPGNLQSNSRKADAKTAGLNTDSTKKVTGHQLYDQAAEAHDRNGDGIAD